MSNAPATAAHHPAPWAIGIPDVHDPLADLAVRTISSGPDVVAIVLDAVHDDGASAAYRAAMANAALIAAAPALLAALRVLVADIDEARVTGRDMSPLASAAGIAREAIAKATA